MYPGVGTLSLTRNKHSAVPQYDSGMASDDAVATLSPERDLDSVHSIMLKSTHNN